MDYSTLSDGQLIQEITSALLVAHKVSSAQERVETMYTYCADAGKLHLYEAGYNRAMHHAGGYTEEIDRRILAQVRLKPRSQGQITVGQYSADSSQPPFEVLPLGRGVLYDEEKLGTPDHYTLVLKFHNRNDSPVIVTVRRREQVVSKS